MLRLRQAQGGQRGRHHVQTQRHLHRCDDWALLGLNKFVCGSGRMAVLVLDLRMWVELLRAGRLVAGDKGR